jgi:hypothetical protein
VSAALPTWTYWAMLAASVVTAVAFLVVVERVIDLVLPERGDPVAGKSRLAGAARAGGAFFQAGVVAPPERLTGETAGGRS